MNWIEMSISEFGRQIGINGLTLNSDGKLLLDAEDGSSIGMINADTLPLPELVIYIALPIASLYGAKLKSALQLPNLRKFHPWPLQVAASDKKIFYSARIPHRSISLATINESIKILKIISKDIF